MFAISSQTLELRRDRRNFTPAAFPIEHSSNTGIGCSRRAQANGPACLFGGDHGASALHFIGACLF
jgi:hypothetical protein